jgi:rSAM/selenodomain-associated transferase 1
MSKDAALVIYARPPIPGQVKTRMQPRIGPQESARLYAAMLCDLLERMPATVSAIAETCIAWSSPYAPDGEMASLARGLRTETQQGDDLGERMARTLQEKLQHGCRRVVIIGSDSPTLPSIYLKHAFDALTRADIVLGPADDGGYYLLGARRLHLALLRDMPWSTDQVLAITRKRVRKQAIPCEELPTWRDVDTVDDLVRLKKELDHMKARGAADFPGRTFGAVAALQRAGLLS